jgi:hypothetical protein
VLSSLLNVEREQDKILLCYLLLFQHSARMKPRGHPLHSSLPEILQRRTHTLYVILKTTQMGIYQSTRLEMTDI